MPSHRLAGRLPAIAAAVAAALGAAIGSAPPARASVVTNFSYTGGLQTFTVPSDGSYYIVAAGARGGSTEIAHGGIAGEAIGTFALHTGSVLDVLVGGAGANGGSTSGGGGGGGSFVVFSGSALVIGGGGGGSGRGSASTGGIGGTTNTTEQTGGAGGSAANGGGGGGGGGGFATNGGTGAGGDLGGRFGPSFVFGGIPTAGGEGGTPASVGGGGGGGANVGQEDTEVFGGGGGGGGFAGGAGGDAVPAYNRANIGQGGASFISPFATNPIFDLSSPYDDFGHVQLIELSNLGGPNPVPEPGSLAVFGSGFLGLSLLVLRRWRR